MELDLAHEEPPSWLSIITKAKRFPIINFGPGPSRPETARPRCHSIRRNEESSGTSRERCRGGLTLHPKKNRNRCGAPSSSSEGLEEDSVQINVMDLTSRSSSSSSPSPGLRSCGSASSAEDDTTSTCTSTLSVSPGLLTGEEDDAPRRLPRCGSNQISVIRSTSSFLRVAGCNIKSHHSLSNLAEDHDEPQDLSLKPKRLLMSSEKIRTEEEDCVQDLRRVVERHHIDYDMKPALKEEVQYASHNSGVQAALTSTSAISKRDYESSIFGSHQLAKTTSASFIRFKSLQSLQATGIEVSSRIVKDESFVAPERINPANPTLIPGDLVLPEVEIKQRRGRKRKEEEPNGARFDCFLCNFTCVKDNVLKNHMTRMHTVKGNRGNVKCTVCGFSAMLVAELRAHQEAEHGQGAREEGGGTTTESKVAFHACSHCTKKFRSQSQLEAHLRLIAQKQLWKDLKTRRMMS